MKTFRYATLLAFFFPILLFSQTAADVVVPVTVATTPAPSIILSWPTPAAGVTQVVVLRKSLFDLSWTLLAILPPTATTYTDVGVGFGQAREYRIEHNGGTPSQRVGLVYAGQDIPALTGSRGKVVLITDQDLSAPLTAELSRFEQDLRGDGWQVLRHDVNTATSTVPSIKALIRADWEADPNTLCVLLFGNIPVPYSGEIAPDGHGDHVGAWPTDYYYGDFDEELWTDALVNNVTASRAANRNVPGDGKFDQSQTPSLPEVIVSRVDFSNLNGWDVSQTELYRRYLNKNHAFRTGAYKPQSQTLVDDNFGYFVSGEAFAQNGWRNGDAITGPNTVQAGDFFNDTDNQSFLIGYGCGGGTYTSADGVGTSDNFKTDSVNVVFSMLFGSYFGDWDYEDNPLMPSALASKGGILTCSWAGRPNWHLHHMSLGQPIWLSTYWTWLNSFLAGPVYPPNYGADLIHVGLLGDPTLRAHSVRPPASATAAATCSGVNLNWAASTDAALGYYVYRAPSPDSVFQLITPSPVPTTAFTDASPLNGLNFYQVKSLKREVVPTGSYFNQSIGTPTQATFIGPPQAAATASPVSCNGGSNGSAILTVSGGTAGYSFAWSNGASSQNLNNVAAGSFTVIVTDQLGCTATAAATVTQPSALAIQTIVTNVSCFGGFDGSVVVNVSGGTPPYTYFWSNDLVGGPGGSALWPDATLPVHSDLAAGTYTVTITDANGCTKTVTATVTEPPAISAQAVPTNVLCNGAATGTIALTVTGGTPNYQYNWADLPGSNDPKNRSNLAADTYSVTITDANGCTHTAGATVTQPTAIALQTSTSNASCNGGTDGAVNLTVTGGSGAYTYHWSNNATTQDLNNVAAGTYSVTVTDANSCTKTATATVNQATTLSAQPAVVPVQCFGSSDGSVNLTVNGGTTPYTFLWTNGATTEDIGNVPAGAYGATVTDANNCQFIVAPVNLPSPSAITATTVANPALCNGTATGSLMLSASGGSPGYTYLWSNGAITQNLINLPAGTYSGTLTDSHGCTKTYSGTVQEPTAVQIATDALNPTCFGGNNGVATMTASGGTPGYTYQWSVSGVIVGSGATLGNQPAGTLDGIATDAHGCTATVSITLTQPTAVVGTYTVEEILCAGNEATLNVLGISGGAGGPYQYSLDFGVLLDPAIPSSLAGGQHMIVFYDALGCSTNQDLLLPEPAPITSSMIVVPTSCPGAVDGAVTAIVTGGVEPMVFQWSNGAAGPSINNLSAGTYTLSVTDANGCTHVNSATILSPPPFVAPITGDATACVGFPETYSLPAGFSIYHWFPDSNGEVTQGQGTSQVTIVWNAEGPVELIALIIDSIACGDTSILNVVVETCVGTKDLSAGSVQVMPNPFNERLDIRYAYGFQPGALLRLSDVQGRILFEEKMTSPDRSLDTADLPAGAYFLQIIENERTGVWKVIKQK